MMNLGKQELLLYESVENLPSEAVVFLGGKNIVTELNEIGRLKNLLIKEIGNLCEETAKAISGETRPDQFAEKIRLALDEENRNKAGEISAEIENRFLAPIRNSLRQSTMGDLVPKPFEYSQQNAGKNEIKTPSYMPTLSTKQPEREWRPPVLERSIQSPVFHAPRPVPAPQPPQREIVEAQNVNLHTRTAETEPVIIPKRQQVDIFSPKVTLRIATPPEPTQIVQPTIIEKRAPVIEMPGDEHGPYDKEHLLREIENPAPAEIFIHRKYAEEEEKLKKTGFVPENLPVKEEIAGIEAPIIRTMQRDIAEKGKAGEIKPEHSNWLSSMMNRGKFGHGEKPVLKATIQKEESTPGQTPNQTILKTGKESVTTTGPAVFTEKTVRMPIQNQTQNQKTPAETEKKNPTNIFVGPVSQTEPKKETLGQITGQNKTSFIPSAPKPNIEKSPILKEKNESAQNNTKPTTRPAPAWLHSEPRKTIQNEPGVPYNPKTQNIENVPIPSIATDPSKSKTPLEIKNETQKPAEKFELPPKTKNVSDMVGDKLTKTVNLPAEKKRYLVDPYREPIN